MNREQTFFAGFIIAMCANSAFGQGIGFLYMLYSAYFLIKNKNI